MRINKGVKIYANGPGQIFHKYSPTTETLGDFAFGEEVLPGHVRIRYNTKKGKDLQASAPAEMLSQLNVLSSSELMDKILHALDKTESLSVVSVGATEAFVMAQYTIFTEEEFMNHREAYNANLGHQSGFFHRGIRFPNLKARNDAVSAARQADIIGYNTIVEPAKGLTEQVFTAYDIRPQYVFEANLRRVFMFSQPEKMARILKEKDILLIGSLAAEARQALEQKWQKQLKFNITGAINILEYEDIPRVKAEIGKYQFDLCFLSAGVNALILAPYIAATYGKVAFDIGWGMQSMITDQIFTDAWIEEIIGIDTLLEM